ncbi:MAG: tyrosine recombinase XerC [Eubacteriales bacterium]|nr:tyrosine recombinase XerC [Eubacteriales bacterium]
MISYNVDMSQIDKKKVEDSFPRLEEFLGYFQAIKGRSAGTIKQYRYDLVMFFRFLLRPRESTAPEDPEWEEIDLAHVDDEYLKEVKLSDLYAYVSWLAAARNAAPSTRARRISSLRSFFGYLTNKANILEENIADRLETPKLIKKLPKHLSLDESKELLTAAAESETRYSSRDYCILTLFLNCGLRLAELCSIDIPNIKEDRITVMGKGGKERTIYLNGACIRALREYLPERFEPKKKDKDALFISRLGTRVQPRAVQNIIKKYLVTAGLDPKRYSTHKLRHTAATLMYQYGEVDIRSLQAILGHSTVATTEIYTHVDNKQLHNAVDKNPLNQMPPPKVKEETSTDQ